MSFGYYCRPILQIGLLFQAEEGELVGARRVLSRGVYSPFLTCKFNKIKMIRTLFTEIDREKVK
jgi:hypothetical protein